MDERNNLLNCIESNPEEDTPRLMLADYLEENAQSDVDVATSEFIKISCKNSRKKQRQYNNEGKWLQSNWHRLIPTLKEDGFTMRRRVGRYIDLNKKYEIPGWNGKPIERTRWVMLEFWKGLVANVRFFDYNSALKVLPSLLKDQSSLLATVDMFPLWERRQIIFGDTSEFIQCYTIEEQRCREVYPFIENCHAETDDKKKLFLGDRSVAVKHFSDALKKYCLSL